MKNYILNIKPKSGFLTDLQSDTIYGHFCWRLKEQLGDKRLEDFISLYKNKQPIFLLSDGLPKVKDIIRFPRPYIFLKSQTKENKVDKIIEFVAKKEEKERNYLNLSELNNFLSTGKIELEEVDEREGEKKDIRTKIRKKRIIEESLRVSVQIDRNSFASAEGKLYSYNPKFTRDDVSFVILVKVIDEGKFKEFNCENILNDTFIVGFGKKKSSGYGQFEVVGYKEFPDIVESDNAKSFMVLGNYLPHQDDKISPIGYDINTKYGKFGEELALSENPFKNPIVFMTAGSCFMAENDCDFYGRVTFDGEISGLNNFAVQFGMPFILKFNFLNIE